MRGRPKLVNIPGRRKLYVQYTPPGSRRTKVESTGVEGRADNPPERALICLGDFIADPPALAFGRKVGQETEKFAMKNVNYDVNRPR